MFRKVLPLLGLTLSLIPSRGDWALSTSGPAVSSVTITRPDASNFGGPFSLIDQNSRPVSSTDFRGTPMLIYFGYTNCADACPLDIQAVSNVIDMLDRHGPAVVPIFITVDPQRDTPARLRNFLAAFDSHIVGLTGPVATITKITTAYGASGEGDRLHTELDGRYDVLHAAIAYLMGRHGEFLDFVRLRDRPDAIAEKITNVIAASDRRGS